MLAKEPQLMINILKGWHHFTICSTISKLKFDAEPYPVVLLNRSPTCFEVLHSNPARTCFPISQLKIIKVNRFLITSCKGPYRSWRSRAKLCNWRARAVTRRAKPGPRSASWLGSRLCRISRDLGQQKRRGQGGGQQRGRGAAYRGTKETAIGSYLNVAGPNNTTLLFVLTRVFIRFVTHCWRECAGCI